MTQQFDHEIEIERLKNLLKRREAQLVHAYDWRYDKELELNDLKQQHAAMKAEVERLKRGDFTEEEFHNLCHNLSEDDEQRFKQGCSDYQKKLFGCKGRDNKESDKTHR
jgi:Tfp pilus assembly protein PilO